MFLFIKSKRFFVSLNKVFHLTLWLLCCFLFLSCQNNLQEKGEKALAIGDFDRAVLYFSNALDEDPVSKEARYGLALAYFGLAEDAESIGQNSLVLWQKAYNEFRILEKLDTLSRFKEMYSTCIFYWVRSTLEAHPEAPVLSALNKSIDLDSLNFFSFNLKALVLESQGLDSLAQQIFIYIIAKDPQFLAAYSNLGNLYWDAGDIENAWDIWSMGLQVAPGNSYLKTWTQRAQDSLTVRLLRESL